MQISQCFKLSIVMRQNRHIAETTQEAGFLLASTMHGRDWTSELERIQGSANCGPGGRGVYCANGCALGLPLLFGLPSIPG